MRSITFFVLLVGAVAAVGCGDDEPNRNPMAPSAMQSSTSIQEATSPVQAGSGGSVGVVPAAGSPFDAGNTRGASSGLCIPDASIIEAAERNRQANHRPPGYARNWRSLLAFFGERTDVDPVTLAEMDARVGRWAGWAPFRDEVARLIGCGWTPPTSIQAEPEPEDTPLPAQAPPAEPVIVKQSCDGTHPTSGAWAFTEGDKAISYPDGTRIDDDNIVQGDRCGTSDGTAFRAIDDDIAYVRFRKTGGVATPSQTSGSVELNMTCKQWYEAIWTHSLDFGRTGNTAMENEFKASNCVVGLSGGTPADNFNGYVNIGTWDWIPWTKTSGTMNYPDVDCSWLRSTSINSSVMYGHRRDRDNRKPLQEAKDRICTTWTVAGATWTVDVSRPVKIAGASWSVNYRAGQPYAISFSFSGGRTLSGGTTGPWELSQAPCGNLPKPNPQAIEPVSSDQIVFDPGSFEPCS